jgi:hypothetical protein
MIGLLSIPNWLIHLGSVVEWAVAMGLFYMLGRRTGNFWLKIMPIAMIPYMLSGWCAILYHSTLDNATWLNDLQAYLTFGGSCAFALWAFLFFRSLTAGLGVKSGARQSVKERGSHD